MNYEIQFLILLFIKIKIIIIFKAPFFIRHNSIYATVALNCKCTMHLTALYHSRCGSLTIIIRGENRRTIMFYCYSGSSSEPSDQDNDDSDYTADYYKPKKKKKTTKSEKEHGLVL